MTVKLADNQKHEAREFMVDTEFQKKARRPGGVPRERAIEQAEIDLEELKPNFTGWLDRELQMLADAIHKANTVAPDDNSWVDTAHLHSRRLRDVGATMGYELVSFVANNLCEIFEVANVDYSRRLVSIHCHLEALYLVKQEQYRSKRPEDLPELSEGLRLVVESASISPDDSK